MVVLEEEGSRVILWCGDNVGGVWRWRWPRMVTEMAWMVVVAVGGDDVKEEERKKMNEQ